MMTHETERFDAIMAAAEAAGVSKPLALRVLRVITDRGGLITDILDELESSLRFCAARPDKASAYLRDCYDIDYNPEWEQKP